MQMSDQNAHSRMVLRAPTLLKVLLDVLYVKSFFCFKHFVFGALWTLEHKVNNPQCTTSKSRLKRRRFIQTMKTLDRGPKYYNLSGRKLIQNVFWNTLLHMQATVNWVCKMCQGLSRNIVTSLSHNLVYCDVVIKYPISSIPLESSALLFLEWPVPGNKYFLRCRRSCMINFYC